MHIFSLNPTFAIEKKDNAITEQQDISKTPTSTYTETETENKSSEKDTKPVQNNIDTNLNKALLNVTNNQTENKINVQSETELGGDTSLKTLSFYSKNIALTETFNAHKKDYTAIIKGTDTSFRIYGNCISATSQSSTLNIYYNNDLVIENTKSMPDKTFTFVKGINNQLKIEVISQNGEKSYYTVNIKREGSSNTELNSIAFYSNNVTLDKNFNSSTKNYIGKVKSGDTSVRTNQYGGNRIETKDLYSTISLYFNDKLIVENVRTVPQYTFQLQKGISNIMKIVVTAENGDQSTYTITFIRDGYDNTRLNPIGFYSNNVTLDKEFNADITSYIGKVKNGDTSVKTNQAGYNRIETNDPYATISLYYNKELIVENVRTVPQYTFQLQKGISNIMEIVVTAESGKQITYTIAFEREGYNNTDLSLLAFYSNNVTLDKPLSSATKNYIGVVKAGSTSVSTNQYGYNRIETADPYSTINLYFNDDLIFENVRTVPQKTFQLVKDKENIMKIEVVSESGKQSVYTVNFKREGYNDTSLNSIGFYSNNVTLDKDFDPETKEYTALVKAGDISVKTNQYGYNRIETRDPYSTIDVYFNDKLIFENVKTVPQETFTLEKGKRNVMKIVVTAENGDKSTYTITFQRESNNDTYLKSLAFYSNNITLDKNYQKDIYDYIGTIKEGDTYFKTNEHGIYRIEANDPYATISVYFNGEIVFENVKTVPQKTFELEKGVSNIMEIVVTAENGDKKTYTITFAREFDSSVNIKDVLIDKASLDLTDDIINATMYSWQDISLSNLTLEDSWADYKVTLNNNKEVSLNETFDLSFGENKLDIEVTSNNGNKKMYPIIFERSDTVKPLIDLKPNTKNWTNEDVIINITTSDESGIRYIELPDGKQIFESEAKFYASKNGEYTFKVYDNFLNETTQTINITNIDKEAPELKVESSNNNLTNQNIDIIINATDNININYIETPNGDKIKEDILTYKVIRDGTYTFKAVDIAGNVTEKQIIINNIDSENPILSVELSNSNWTNEDITLHISALSNKGIKYIILPDGSKIEDCTAEYTITKNGVYTISTESLGGNISTKKIVIDNIDNSNPSISLSPSTTKLTNQDIEVTINSSDNSGIRYIILPNGEKVYKSNHKYIIKSNGKYNFTVVDLAGNYISKDIEINNIDKNPPVIKDKKDIINLSEDTIILDLSNILSSSGIQKVILPNGEEILEPKDKKIIYKVKYNDTYTFKIIDKAGNSTNIDIEAKNLIEKKELPDTSGLLNYLFSFNILSLLIGISLLKRKHN